MPIEILQSFRFICDYCHVRGPSYQNRPKGDGDPKEVPPGWVAIRINRSTYVKPDVVRFACPECTPSIKRQAEDWDATIIAEGE